VEEKEDKKSVQGITDCIITQRNERVLLVFGETWVVFYTAIKPKKPYEFYQAYMRSKVNSSSKSLKMNKSREMR
jgi:hypothetical protein